MKKKLAAFIHSLRSNAFVVNVITLLSGSAVAQLIPLAVYPLVTRLYTPAELGLFATFMTYAGAVAVIAGLRYEQAVLLAKKEKDAQGVFGIAVGASVIMACLSLLFVEMLGDWFAAVTGLEVLRSYLWLFPLAVLFTGSFNSISMLANRYKKYRLMARSAITQSGTSSAAKVAGGLLHPGPVALIISYILGHAGASALLWAKTRKMRILRNLPNRRQLTALFRHYRYFPLYDMPQVLVFTISGNLPLIVFTRYFSESEAGFYALAFTVVFRPLNLIAQALRKVLAQKTIKQYNQGKPVYEGLIRLLKRMLLVVIPMALIAGIFAPPVFTFVFGSSWAQVGTYVQILLPLLIFIFLETVFDFIPNLFFRQKTVLLISLLYFALRLLSLAAGVWLNDLIAALLFFSASGMLIKAGSLLWYLRLARKNEASQQ